MKVVEMVMPQMGESIMECTVLSWLKNPGDLVEADDSILEVATDKVDTEVPSPFSGTLVETLVKEGDVVAIGAVVARIEVQNDAGTAIDSKGTEPEPMPISEPETMIPSFGLPSLSTSMEVDSGKDLEGNADSNNGFFSPLVLSIAKEEGIDKEELNRISGTGAESRVTKKDVLNYIAQRKAPAQAISETQPSTPKKVKAGSVEIVEMDRMRRMIAQRMLDSKNISAHVTSFIETDMTTIVQWRNAIKNDFRKQNGDSITFTPILIEAVVKAIKEYPLINVSVEGESLLLKKDINIGMAVALPDGNLIVPVIHQADQYNLIGLAKKVNELARRARENKLKADDLAGGTYTISNIGTFGNLMGTPIIVQPQVAIMAFGAIEKKPSVIETPQGDLLGIRHKMFISHSYDHRVVDGSLGGMFLKRVSDHLQNFDPKRPIV
ncbi:dihydrolipoamide acetyltransferase family protein [Arundinibacter roseus]|uniref:Dihydrolipoamide acetyltransferase component of pyruvate dehydrogenase complex n=1 Tax=Arundinibacter roseus TaxID=2070510 RepID=A0A4R4KG36_9BACT|nr:dihydrolipoamide acetyltransferase family protein [Arundinibacter roseus]TDB67004.1 2-oxo acid dehydrogenase subunit E2 [Arundinibacter roseus]